MKHAKIFAILAALPVALTALASTSPAHQPGGSDEIAVLGETRVYQVQQTVQLSDIPAGTKTVRWWISIPDNERHQDLLDFAETSAPGSWRVERDAVRGNRFLYVEVDSPKESTITAVVDFTLRREPVLVSIDPAKAGPITDAHRKLYAEEVRRDAPHMSVTPRQQEMADTACGKDTNPATQAHKLLQLVADSADHYSKDPTKPTCGIGDAETCMEKGGGCCTDLHSLFISLARARGIPARLEMGYRINPKNEGKVYDPGYRCWVEYFVPNYGWIPADIVEADATGGFGPTRWFTGLTERRLWLNEGREFQLRPAQAGGPVNTMIIGYAELDGKPARVLPEGELATQLTRTIRFTEVK
jgi:transglutaminase-like putative cysteine protease